MTLDSARAERAAAGLVAPHGARPHEHFICLLLAFESPDLHEQFARETFPKNLREFDGPGNRFRDGWHVSQYFHARSVRAQFAPGDRHEDWRTWVKPSALAEFSQRHGVCYAVSVNVWWAREASPSQLVDEFARFCRDHNAVPTYSGGADTYLTRGAAGLIAPVVSVHNCRVTYVLFASEPPSLLEQFARETFPRDLQDFHGSDSHFRRGTHAHDETLVAVSVAVRFAPEYQREHPDARIEPPALAEFGRRHNVYRALSIQVGSSLQATRLVREFEYFCRWQHNAIVMHSGGTHVHLVPVPHDLPVTFTIIVYGATRALAIHGATWFYARLLARYVSREDSGRDVDLGLLQLVYGHNHNGHVWLYRPTAEGALRQAFHDIGVDPAPTTIQYAL